MQPDFATAECVDALGTVDGAVALSALPQRDTRIAPARGLIPRATPIFGFSNRATVQISVAVGEVGFFRTVRGMCLHGSIFFRSAYPQSFARLHGSKIVFWTGRSGEGVR